MRAMKDSGIPWIGMIPEGWTVCQYKRCVSINNGKEYSDIVVEEGGYPVMGSGGEFARASKYLYDGEVILMGRKGTIDKPLYFCGRFWSVDTMFYCIPKENTYPKYMYYQACTFPFAMHSISTALPSMTQSDLGNNPVVLPSLIEQQRIAEFLDTKCGEIDEMIALQEKTVEELKAYKQSVITEAVTKGLNPDAPMKDSGIPWIGLIPQGWIVNKMLRIAEVITDYVASGSFADLAGNVTYLDYPDYAMLVRTIDVSGKGKNASRVYIDEHAYKFLSNSNLHGGELMLPSIGAVGDIYIVPKLYEFMSLAPNAIMMRTNQCDKYYYYYFLGKGGRTSLLDIAQSTAQPKFNKTDFRALKVIMPPLSEQQAIAAYLDEKCAEIDNLIEIKQQKAEELKAYKKSLIYEYVTGKKEVV